MGADRPLPAGAGEVVMARNSAPAFQWYPADWMRKTRGLSPAAKGVWIDLICQMWWEDDQCSITGSASKLARVCGCSASELVSAITELKNEKICDVNGEFDGECNGVVTVMSRRMRKDRDNRENTRKRVQRHRNVQGKNGKRNGNVTQMFDLSSSSSSCTKVHSPPTPQGVEGEDFLPDWKPLQDALLATGKCPGVTREMLAMAFRGVDVGPDEITEIRVAAEGMAGTIGTLMPWLRKRALELGKKETAAVESGSLHAPVNDEARKRKIREMKAKIGGAV